MKKKEKAFCLRMPEGYYEKLEKKADDEGRSVNAHIVQIIKKELGIKNEEPIEQEM